MSEPISQIEVNKAVRVLSAGFMGMTPSRTVAICGHWSKLTIVAMMLPPKAGRICKSRFA